MAAIAIQYTALNMVDVACGLRYNRSIRGVSQEAVGAAIGCSGDVVRRYEHSDGNSRIDLNMLRAMCAYYAKPIRDVEADGVAHKGYTYDVLHRYKWCASCGEKMMTRDAHDLCQMCRDKNTTIQRARRRMMADRHMCMRCGMRMEAGWYSSICPECTAIKGVIYCERDA